MPAAAQRYRRLMPIRGQHALFPGNHGAVSSGAQASGIRGGGAGRAGGAGRCRDSGVNHQSSEASQPSPGGGGAMSRHSGLSAGQRSRRCMWLSCPRQGRTRRSQASPRWSAHRRRLMAGLTSRRSSPGASAAMRMSVACRGVQRAGSTADSSGRTREGIDNSSRCEAGTRGLGRRSSQISASSPVWWLAWPQGRGPPRGCDRSPIQRSGRPARRAWPATWATSAMVAGCPQWRLRLVRMACQPGPSGGRATAPAMQPRLVVPMDCAGPAVGRGSAAHSAARATGPSAACAPPPASAASRDRTRRAGLRSASRTPSPHRRAGAGPGGWRGIPARDLPPSPG